jgi:hypothetical protein
MSTLACILGTLVGMFFSLNPHMTGNPTKLYGLTPRAECIKIEMDVDDYMMGGINGTNSLKSAQAIGANEKLSALAA